MTTDKRAEFLASLKKYVTTIDLELDYSGTLDEIADIAESVYGRRLAPQASEPLNVADPNVQAVIVKHLERAATGLKKYGVTTETLSQPEALKHLQEELMDAAVYLEAFIAQPAATPAEQTSKGSIPRIVNPERYKRTCPECDSLRVKGDFDPDVGKWFECMNCGHKWSEQQEPAATAPEVGRDRLDAYCESLVEIENDPPHYFRLRLKGQSNLMWRSADRNLIEHRKRETFAAIKSAIEGWLPSASEARLREERDAATLARDEDRKRDQRVFRCCILDSLPEVKGQLGIAALIDFHEQMRQVCLAWKRAEARLATAESELEAVKDGDNELRKRCADLFAAWNQCANVPGCSSDRKATLVTCAWQLESVVIGPCYAALPASPAQGAQHGEA